MDNVKVFNLDRLWKEINFRVKQDIDLVLSTGVCQGGNITELVENKISHLTNTKHAVTFHSCTDALVQGLRNLNLPSNSEILVPAYTFIATASSILLAGLKPVFVDVGNDYHIDLAKAKEKITSNTKVLLYVTLWGSPANKVVETFCNDNNLLLVEDAAQSLGAPLSNSAFSVLSFSPTKPCTTLGSGGALVTNDKELAQLARLGRLHGKVNNATPSKVLGMNSMISTTEAVVLNNSLELLTNHKNKRQRIASLYTDEISNKYELPVYKENCTYSKFVIKCESRDKLAEHLKSNGVLTQIHYSILPIQEKLFDTNTNEYTNSLQLQQTSLTIPNCPYMTNNEIEKVIQCLKEF